MLIHEKLYTADELWELSHRPEYSDKRLRLLKGILYVLPLNGWAHGDIATELLTVLSVYAKAHNLGLFTTSKTGYRLNENTVLAPDVGFIAQSRIPEELPSGYVPFAPDLAVEVLSPSNTDVEMTRKIELYLCYGTRLVWIVDPELKTIQVYRALENSSSAQVDFLKTEDTLTGGDVLPGFEIAIKILFSLED
jgi:Uma2 family endonuclease